MEKAMLEVHKYHNNHFRLIIFIVYFFCASCSSARTQKKETVYFRDFDHINVKGIGQLDNVNGVFPYVMMIRYADSSLKVSFHITKRSVYEKRYKYIRGVLTSTIKLPQQDGGCLGFTEVQYYFEHNKRMIYTFCGKKATPAKEKIYSLSANMWENDNYDYVSRTVYISNYDIEKKLALITFNAKDDINGKIFNSELVSVLKNREYVEGDSIVFEGNEYDKKPDGSIITTQRYKYKKQVSPPVISIWRVLESYNPRFPPF